MKRFLIIIFASFYLIIASGLSVSMHYCGGKLKEISFLQNLDDEGCCGSKKKSKGCCNEESKLIKVKDDHFSNNFLKIVKSPIKTITAPVLCQLFTIHNVDVDPTTLYYHSPPVFYDNPIYLKHRVLII